MHMVVDATDAGFRDHHGHGEQLARDGARGNGPVLLFEQIAEGGMMCIEARTCARQPAGFLCDFTCVPVVLAVVCQGSVLPSLKTS